MSKESISGKTVGRLIRRLENICNQNLSGADALRRVFLDQLRELLEKTNRDADRIEGGRPDEDLRSLEERMKKKT